MRFCDKRILYHLLDGGEVRRKGSNCVIFYNKDKMLIIKTKINNDIIMEPFLLYPYDINSNDWEIVKPEINWNKIIQDKILCIFSDYKDFKHKTISTLVEVNYNDSSFKTNEQMLFRYCVPFISTNYKIIKNLKEYEK